MSTPEKIRHTPRLYVEGDLAISRPVSIEGDQAHYLRHVMRMKEGEALRLFNGRDGEFLARLGASSKNAVEAMPEKQLRLQQAGTDLTLCAAPIKKAHFDTMIEKATELGVAVIQPVLTERTQIREVNTVRARSIAIEAAEQSERVDIPEIRAPVTLADLIVHWPKERTLIVCAELGEALQVREAFLKLQSEGVPLPSREGLGEGAFSNPSVGILTGPEGGFAEKEFEMLRKAPGAVFVRLGSRILRADTAAIAALTLWQALCGDWK